MGTIDLTAQLATFRSWLLEHRLPDLQPGRVLHAITPGPTQPENFGPQGTGPWARIYPGPIEAGGPSSSETVSADYLLELYVPRVITTDDLLGTVLHEYLHIGAEVGTLVGPPTVPEAVIDAHARRLVHHVRGLPGFSEQDDLFSTDWTELKQRGVTGSSFSWTHARQGAVELRRIDLSDLE